MLTGSGACARPAETAIVYLVHGQDIAVPLRRTLEVPPDLAVAAADRVWSSSRMFHARKKLTGYRLEADDALWWPMGHARAIRYRKELSWR
jgi:hypothetical protein